MDREVYRSVPFRFAINESNADVCKLEKLTNLFPDMKQIIELELFKINNLTQMINRLSNIFNVSSVVDTRDDTLHLSLGPYHLSLGPAIFGAMHFRNISTALLASSQSKTSNENLNHYQKRRHDAALRRFRRAVRKLIQIKSILDKIRLASILTPYNQYELYRHGIYDLVLAGYKHTSQSTFIDDDFIQQINDVRSINDLNEKSPLVVSKYIKINTLLHLLSPAPHHSENNSTSTKSDDTKNFTNKENSSQSLFTSTTTCCSNHSQKIPLIMFPINRSISHQSTHLYTPKYHLKRNSRSNSRRNSSVFSDPVKGNSLPDLIFDENSQSNISTNQEDLFVNRISSLLTNYLLSNINNKQDKLQETINSLSSTMETNEFDKLLQRIKTVVENKLSHQDESHVKTSTNRRKLHLSSKSQSFDDTNLKFYSTIPELNDNSLELSSLD